MRQVKLGMFLSLLFYITILHFISACGDINPQVAEAELRSERVVDNWLESTRLDLVLTDQEIRELRQNIADELVEVQGN